jgi:2-acylglycerol O-acyltransferase 2
VKKKDWFGWTLPVVHGRGIWNYSFGMLPFRTPLVTVVGKPIPVEKNDNPTPELIDHYHSFFKTALLDLHERWRVRVGETQKLRIIA